MAGIYRRGSVWWARARKGGREYRESLETKSRAVAEARFRKWSERLNSLSYDGHAMRTFDEAGEHFLDHHMPTLKPQSQRRYMTSLRMLLIHGNFEGLPLDQIGRDRLAEFERARRAGGASPPTIRRDLAFLSSVIEQAVQDWDLPIQNPVPPFLRARRKRGLAESPPRTRYLTTAEEAALLAECGAYLRPMVAFAIDTGLRLEEQLSLTWPQVDLTRRRVVIHATKSGRPRTVPLNERAGTIAGTLPRRVGKPGEPDWVFTKSDGSRYGKLTRGLAGAAKRAGITDLKWHDLRRTCGCRLLQEHGLSMEEVRDWLGHASVVQTERAYAFLGIDHLQDKLDRAQKRAHGHAD